MGVTLRFSVPRKWMKELSAAGLSAREKGMLYGRGRSLPKGWHHIRAGIGEVVRWDSNNGILTIAIEVAPKDGPGYGYAVITGNKRTDEYNFDNDSGMFRSIKAAKTWAHHWMKKHQSSY